MARGRPASSVLGETMSGIGDALYPRAAFLTAALILQCLTELSGLNLSAMLRTEPSDLVYTGKSSGMLKLQRPEPHRGHTGRSNQLQQHARWPHRSTDRSHEVLSALAGNAINCGRPHP